MSDNRLNGLAVLYVHWDIDLEVNEVIDRFAIRHPRRMKLIKHISNMDPE